MTVDLAAKINEFVKANRKVWPEWPKEAKPRRRNPRHRHRDQVYWVSDSLFSSNSANTIVLLYDKEVLEIDDISYLPPYEVDVEECWYAHYGLAKTPGEGVRRYTVTAKEARRLWQNRFCTDRKPNYDTDC